jgi:iron complex outermembrane receptor protein
MKKSLQQQVSVAATVAAILGGVTMVGYAPASGAQDAGELEEVTVTGSRIVRKDLVSNSPLVTVETEAFENRTGLNVESYLNQMPNFNPAAAPTIQTGEGGNNDVQISAVRSVGISAVSLRGFGPNRNLVLVNGKRPTPINALMVTDTNSIPSALIKRVEIITGGASAVYGADAIGGVTNFILRDDFQGLELDFQQGITEVGDGEETRVYALLGTNIADGRGNITMGAEWYDRQAALEVEREFFTDAWLDPTVGSDLFMFGYNGYSTGFNGPSVATANTIFNGNRPFGFAPGANAPVLNGLRFNADSTMFSLLSDISRGRYKGPTDTGEFGLQRILDTTASTQGNIINVPKWNNTEALASSPQERYALFASGTFDITDDVQFFTRGTWSESKTQTKLIPTNASFGWEAQVPYEPGFDSPVDPSLNYTDQGVVAAVLANPAAFANPNFIGTGQAGARHPVPVELAVLLNSRVPANIYCLQGGLAPDGRACGLPPLTGNIPTSPTTNPTLVGQSVPGTGRLGSWIMETYPNDSFDQRATMNTNTVWQVEAGINFNLPFGDWTGEAYFSHGESSTYNIAYGNNSLSRWRALVTAADYGRNARISGNQNGASPGFGAADITCASGFYDMIFRGDVPASQDCKDAVGATLQTRTQNTQDIGELNLQGGIVDAWAGEIRGAVGLQWRKNAAQFFPDILQSTTSFTDQVIGVYPTAPLDADTSVKDIYAELLIPVLEDVGIKKVEFELGGRYSDYEDTDSTTTYKVTANAEINDWVRFRGGYNRATRAPNLGELFLNRQEIFTIGGANFGDPCGQRSNAPFGAGGAAPDPQMQAGETAPQVAAGQTAAGANSTYLICQAQMGAAGANNYYNLQNAVAGSGTAFNWVLQEGNTELDSEKADTWTAGVVFTSPFDSAWLSGLSASVDWWKVDIEDAIQQYSVDYARFLCYGTVQVADAAGAAAQAASEACQGVSRNTATGGANTLLIQYDNQATIATSGIDLALNWGFGLSDVGMGSLPGRFGMNVQATFLDYYKTKQSPADFDVETDWKGSLGPNLTGTNAGAYSYRLFTTFSYSLPSLNVSMRWRHLPSVVPANRASEDAIRANNISVSNGGEGTLLAYTPGTSIRTKSYDVIDLSVAWNINDTLLLRAGVDNVFDWKPRIVGDNGLAPNPTGARNGYEPGSVALADVCAGQAPGCQNPANFATASTGAGFTNGGYYDILGRRYFLGLKVSF